MTRVGDVVEAALTRWAALTAVGESLAGWEVADGPFVGTHGDKVLTVGVSDGESVDSYVVELDEYSADGVREVGVIRCELAARDGAGVSGAAGRTAVVAALQAISADCSEQWAGAGTSPIDARVGGHRTAHLTSADDGSSITATAFDLLYTAWL